METTKKCKPSDWMKTQMNSPFSDDIGCITDATDEEQDELPYDGDVGVNWKYSNDSGNLNDCTCTREISGILTFVCSEDNKNIKAAANYKTHSQPEQFSSHHCRGAVGTMGISAEMPGSQAAFKKELSISSCSKLDGKEHLTHSKMSNVLLRHFSKGELTSTYQLIECETIPETSLTESINDTVSKPEPSEHDKGLLAYEQWATNSAEYHLEKHEEVNTGDKNKNLLNENRLVLKKPISSTAKYGYKQENLQLINENNTTHIFQNMKEESTLFKRTVSPHELKYEQGQAHYCIPDFFQVASEVKVPTGSDNINSVLTTETAKSFPISLCKSVTANVTENKNNFSSAAVENSEESGIPELLQQLEMLTQHADIQNRIDQLRLNPKVPTQSDCPNASTAVYSGDTGMPSEVFTLHTPITIQSTHGLQYGTTASALPAVGTVEAYCPNPSNLLPELTLGEKMTQILKDQTDEVIKKVEGFSKHMTQETLLLQDNCLALNQLKRYLDTLERNYLTAREEHHNLQLQNYKDKSINVGEFDPERKLEGEIFRLGMLLEDIQEQTDDSKCSLSSLLTSNESAHSSYSLCEGEKSQTIDEIPQTNQFSSEGDKCNLCLHTLQKRGEPASRRQGEPLRKGLLANKHSSNIMRCLSPEQKYPGEGLACHSQDTSSPKFNADKDSSMNGNTNVQEKKTGTCSLFMQRKPTDLSDSNLSSDSEDISAYNSYNDSLNKELTNCETGRYKTFNKRSHGEIRAYSQKRLSSQKAQKNKQPRELVNRLSARQNSEAAKTCCSSTYDKIILSYHCLPSKKPGQTKSAINIQYRNANESNANQILHSTLDHAIETAHILKKATERMVQAVSEDLAKVKRKQL
ncbi:protein AKNAD1 isoform X2 [Lathamus discolor]|uniref:protein AKNAD1 isoform X2 n=1 Tax=Lathamus discolor TaxID=678569 RepID=UPI0032B76990